MAEVKSDSEEESNGWTATVGRVGMNGQRHSGRVATNDFAIIERGSTGFKSVYLAAMVAFGL